MQSMMRCYLIVVLSLLAVRAMGQLPLEPAGQTLADAPSEPWQPPAAATEADRSDSLPEPVDSDGDLLVDGILGEELPGWYRPTYWFGPSPWDTGVELGINGSSGTSDSLSLQTGGYIKRESRFSKLDLDAQYNRTTSGGSETQNNGQFDVRNDWLLDARSPWTLFGSGNLFYDRFQAFNLQTNANMGVGYRFVHEPSLDLIGRLGGGTSREFGGPDERWVPESLLGVEYSQRFFSTQKLSGKIEYYPDLEEMGEFRLVANLGWEIELVQPENLSLKVSANDRYDSTPNGAEPHLVNYSVLLLLKL